MAETPKVLLAKSATTRHRGLPSPLQLLSRRANGPGPAGGDDPDFAANGDWNSNDFSTGE